MNTAGPATAYGTATDGTPRSLVEAVKVGVIGLDGVMSPQTLALLARFGTKRADMTEWWAKTPQAWICPGCDRPKPDLVRLNAHNELMCRLVEHHDHMANALEERFVFHSTSRSEVVATQLGKKFAVRSASMVSAYDRTIVCNDCNNADAEAKRMVSAPRHLSFSPREIRRFINPRPHEAHQVDLDAAKAVLMEILPTFELRMRFINGVARIAASDEHWFQPSADGCNAAHVERSAKWKAAGRNHAGALKFSAGHAEPRITPYRRGGPQPSQNRPGSLTSAKLITSPRRNPSTTGNASALTGSVQAATAQRSTLSAPRPGRRPFALPHSSGAFTRRTMGPTLRE